MDETLRTHLESVRSLLTFATNHLNEAGIYARGRGVYVDAVMLAILSKIIRVGNAICLLIENDFHSEAFGMSRTVLELSLFARYISNKDSFERSAAYGRFFAKDHQQWTKLIEKYYPAAVPNFHPQHDEMLNIAKQFKDPHRWSGQSVRDLAVEEDTFETLPGGAPFLWEFDYEIVYKWTSHYVHGTVVAVDEHATGPREQFKVKGGPNVGKADMALFNVALYLFRAFVAMFRALNYDMPQAVFDRFDSTLNGLV